MNSKKLFFGASTLTCVISATLILGAGSLMAQTFYVPNPNQTNTNTSNEETSPPPTIYVPSGSGDFMASPSSGGRGSSASPKFYNAGPEKRTRRSVTPADTQQRSTRLKEIENINIQTAHNESLENSKRVEAAQQEWKASREAYNKQFMEQKAAEAAKQGVAVQNGAQIDGNDQQATNANGGNSIYLKKDPKTNMAEPPRIFNIFD